MVKGYFTKEQKAQARDTDLVAFLQRQGESVKRSGSEYRWEQGGAKVTIRGNLWFDQYARVGGDAIDFARRFYGLDYPDAVAMMLEGQAGALAQRSEPVARCQPFALPPAHGNMRRAFAYLLKTRYLDPDVVRDFAHQRLIYEQAQYHNVVFVGSDEKGVARHAHMRGACAQSRYKCNAPGSDPRYSFHHIGPGDKLFVFEGPIDMLSFISINLVGWKEQSYVALCSTAPQAAIHILKSNPQIKTVVACLDHDEAGINGCFRLSEAAQQAGCGKVDYGQPPLHKDWNEYLRAQHGLAAIPATDHPGIAAMRELCDALLRACEDKRAARDPLEALLKQYHQLSSGAARSADAGQMTGQALAFAQEAFLFAQKQFCALDKRYGHKQYASMLLRQYEPHQDTGGLENRIRRIGGCLQRVRDACCADAMRTESERLLIARDTLRLCVGGLQLVRMLQQKQEMAGPRKGSVLA